MTPPEGSHVSSVSVEPRRLARRFRPFATPHKHGLLCGMHGVHEGQAPRQRLLGLDGLRGIAVLLVLLFHNRHGLNGNSKIMPAFGWWGVQVFFVLSGYLISRLLDRRTDAPLGEFLREFYGRRALRIFPLYFVAVFVIQVLCWLGFGMDGARDGMPYAWTYTYNFYAATAAATHSEATAHFWSLCVEEQFYLIWPFVIYFCPRSKQRLLLGSVALSGPMIRLALWLLVSAFPTAFYAQPGIALYVTMPAHLDAFAVGALMALFPPQRSGLKLAGASVALLVAGGLVVRFSSSTWDDTWYALGYPLGLVPGDAFVWGYSLINLCSGLLIDYLVLEGAASRLFETPILRYLGKISYGIYVLHYPLQLLVSTLLPSARIFVRLPIQLVLTTVLASASYYLLEAPFLELKERWFPVPTRLPSEQVRAVSS